MNRKTKKELDNFLYKTKVKFNYAELFDFEMRIFMIVIFLKYLVYTSTPLTINFFIAVTMVLFWLNGLHKYLLTNYMIEEIK